MLGPLIRSLRHRAASLPARITAIAMLPALALAILVGGLAISLRQEDLEAGLQQRGLLLTRQLASAADYGVFSGNRTALQTLVDSVSREQSVTAVRILDRDGRLLAQAGTPDSAPLPARLFAPAPLLFSEPIRSPSITIDDLDPAAAPVGKAPAGIASTGTAETTSAPALPAAEAQRVSRSNAEAGSAPGATAAQGPAATPGSTPGALPGSDKASGRSGDTRAGAQAASAGAGATEQRAPGTLPPSAAGSPAPLAGGPGAASPGAAAGGARIDQAGEAGSAFAGRAEVMLSRDGIEEEKRRFALTVIGMLVMVLVVTGLVARRMSRRLSRPVVDAALAVERIGRGETGVRVQPSTIGVLDLLGRGVNDMAARLETSIQDLAARVQEATAQLVEKKEEAERANHAKSRFLAAASHDLRQPMHALGMFIAALEQQPASPMQRELLGQIDRAAAAMGDLLDSLLDISRLDAGVIEKRVAPLPLAAVFERVRSEFTGAAQAKGLELVVRRTGRWVLSDRILLERIVVNLVSNALRYTETGTVLVAARVCGAEREHLRIDVRDSGSGIAPAAQEAIFQEFVQLANPERDRSKGLGLGLSIVRRLVTLLDHRLILRSAPGRGSTFSVILPLATLSSSHLASAPDPVAARPDDSRDSLQTTSVEPSLSAPAGASPTRPADGRNAPAPAAAKNVPKSGTTAPETAATGRVPLRAARFLVIDDDALVRSGLVQLLSSWGGQVAEEAGDSDLPARMVGMPLPDVILCDMRLANGLDGVALLQAIRQAVQRPVRAVVITGDTDPDRVAMAGQGGDPVLHKPVRPAQLRALLRNLLHKPPMKP